MILSNSINNGDDPFVDLSFLENPFVNEEDDLHLPISFFHFPSPFEDDEAFLPPNQALFLRHLQHSLLKSSETPSIPDNLKALESTPKDHQIPRRKSCRKDRHSKINTLRGPRDRRMRLSVQVARDLFGLQDMLGVDKASKTVEWLLLQSKSAIKKLERDINGGRSKTTSSLSESEVISGIDEDHHSIKANQPLANKEKKKTRIKQRKSLPFHPSSKASREKARERARARTEKKQQTLSSMAIIDDHPDRHKQKSSHDLSRISSSLIGFETRDESDGGTQSNIINPCLEVLAEIDKPTSSNSIARNFDHLVNESSMRTDNWSPSSIFSSLHSNGFSPQQYQFEEFPFIGKSWNFYETQLAILGSHLQELD